MQRCVISVYSKFPRCPLNVLQFLAMIMATGATAAANGNSEVVVGVGPVGVVVGVGPVGVVVGVGPVGVVVSPLDVRIGVVGIPM